VKTYADCRSFCRGVLCAVADPCTECTKCALMEIKGWSEGYFCALCIERKVEIFEAMLKNVAADDPGLAKELEDEFLKAAGGSLPRAAELFNLFSCQTTRLYPDREQMWAFYKRFMEKFPSLAKVFYANYESAVSPAFAE